MNICKDCKHRTFGPAQHILGGSCYVCKKHPGDLVPINLVTGEGGQRRHAPCSVVRESVGQVCPDHSQPNMRDLKESSPDSSPWWKFWA